ncbi:MAG: carbamoyltransferase HypF [Actinomycetota bacterium]
MARNVERIEVHGVVQGVGFRPFVYGLATELGLVGRVGNDSAKVFIEVAGPLASVDALVERLVAERPPLARIDRLDRIPDEPGHDRQAGGADGGEGFDRFRIVASRPADGLRTLVPPDTAVCADCLRELFDPGDRRHGHPFITCTNCGPRYTIITDLPYDRSATTMAGFEMCPSCASEYSDPSDRRYHAQPICCPDCGPRLVFRHAAGTSIAPAGPVAAGAAPDEASSDTNAIARAAAALADGAVVAIKGLGGYHLAADATSDRAVGELRRRKARADKPFAVMVADLDRARELARVSCSEATLLTSPASPIVLLRARPDSPISDLVAPANPLIGVLLPSTPVHHLLAAAHPGPLTMTSANRSGEPLAWTADRLDELDDLIDGVLDHDRPIHQPCDDSVVRVVGSRLLSIRRARGYAPVPIDLPPGWGSSAGPVLAAGAELKNTFCLVVDGRASISQHIGDMENLATVEALDAAVTRTLNLHRVEPMTIVADAHPGYQSSRWARRYAAESGRALVEVQHHHAHVAAVLAEHQLDPATEVIGVTFDGTGYGTDCASWGGEVFVGSVLGFDRAAHLAPVPLPGGDVTVREPARMALAHLYAARIDWTDDLPPVVHLTHTGSGLGQAPRDGALPALTLLRQQLERGIGCVPTTSMGRLFDAVASLIGLRHRISYEAQAAIDLELAAVEARPAGRVADGGDRHDVAAAVAGDTADRYRFDLQRATADPAPVLRALVDDLAAGTAAPVLAWRFHLAVVDLVVRLAKDIRRNRSLDTVALSGGVFQNALLTERCVAALEVDGFRVLTHSLVPPNDGGLALGQAWIAANRPAKPSAGGPTPNLS